MNIITPRAHKSEANEASSPFNTSGDKNSAVPTKSHNDDYYNNGD